MLHQIVNNVDVSTFLTFILVLLVSYIIWSYYFTVRINIPGPTPWPIVGNIPNLVGVRNVGNKFLEFQKQYGDMVLLRLGSQPFVVFFGYKAVHEALVTNGEKTKFRPNWFYLFRTVFPKLTGIFFTDGQIWSDGRKFTIVALKDFGVGKKTIDERINEEVQYLVEEFAKQPEKPVEIKKIFPMATSNIISNIIFGSRFRYDDPDFSALLSHVNFFFKTVTINSPVNFFPVLDKLVLNNKISQVAIHLEAIRTYIRSRIEKERESFDPENIRNFLDLYIAEEGKTDSKISEDFVFQIITDLYQAGTETTSVTLQWCMLYMLKYPDVQTKCRDEILKVIGDGRFPSSKDKQTLPYVMATIYEVQRLSSVGPVAAPHAVLEDTYINGKLIPKKSILLCHLMSVNYDTAMWDKPEEFNPDRFINDEGNAFKPEGFSPFSMGPRMCLGRQLAENEVFLFLASFLQRFTFTKANPGDVLSTDGEQTGITRQPIPFTMCFKPR